MKIIRTSFDIPEALHTTVKTTCASIKKPMNEAIREALNMWLIKQENKKEVKE